MSLSEDAKNVKSAKQQINDLVKEAYDAIRKAEDIADQVGEGFSFGVSYGMGGYYQPAGEWDDSGCSYDDSDAQEGHWVSSSENC